MYLAGGVHECNARTEVCDDAELEVAKATAKSVAPGSRHDVLEEKLVECRS